MLAPLIEKVKNPILKTFLFRFYNVFKSFIIPTVLILVYRELQANPGDLSFLLEPSFWNEVTYSVVLLIVGSAVAGIEKVKREELG